MRRTDLDLGFLKGAYLQPELSSDRRVWPTADNDGENPARRGEYEELN